MRGRWEQAERTLRVRRLVNENMAHAPASEVEQRLRKTRLTERWLRRGRAAGIVQHASASIARRKAPAACADGTPAGTAAGWMRQRGFRAWMWWQTCRR